MPTSARSLTGISALLPVIAAAQVTPGPLEQTRNPASLAADSAGSPVEVVLDEPAPAAGANSGLISVPDIFVSRIELNGNSVLGTDTIAEVVGPFEGRAVSIEELHNLRQTLSQIYFDMGYVNSGVVIPDQSVEEGVVQLDVVEGRLSDVEIDGNRALRSNYVARRVRDGISLPFNIGDLQTNLRLLQEDPLIDRINAQLVPGASAGESRLNVQIDEASPWWIGFVADNYRPPSVGEERLALQFVHNSLTGNGDAFSARLGLTDGVQDQAFSYSFPITSANTRIEGYFSSADSEIVEAPFDALDIESLVESWGFLVSHPFIHEIDRRMTVQIGMENRHSTSTLLGFPFSFSEGERNGRAEGTSVFATIDWMQREESGVFAVRGTVNIGVNGLGATENDGELPDSTFTQLIGQMQFVRNIPWRNSRLIVRSTFQVANEPLLAVYRFAVGGRHTVRGYRENLFVRDNGVTASIEYQFPLFVDEAGQDRYNLALAPFVDWGQSWNENDTLLISDTESIASAGLGLLWQPIEGFGTELYYAADIDDQDLPTDTLQDNGWHAQIRYSLNF